MNFKQMLVNAWEQANSLLCVGLDPDIKKMPRHMAKKPRPLFSFNQAIITATSPFVCAYKLNSAMYEADGSSGIEQLRQTFVFLKDKHPKLPIILDYKRGDIGNTNLYSAKFAFEYLAADAITINPYLGKEANMAFLSYKDKGIMILCHTSNPGAHEFQDIEVKNGQKLYEYVAERVMTDWNDHHNCSLVVGSSYPAEQKALRSRFGEDLLMLIPGAGTQGGDLSSTVKASINSFKTGVIINSSREVIFAGSGQDFAGRAGQKARELRDKINQYR